VEWHAGESEGTCIANKLIDVSTGRLKLQDRKMHDWKKLQGWKMTDTVLNDS